MKSIIEVHSKVNNLFVTRKSSVFRDIPDEHPSYCKTHNQPTYNDQPCFKCALAVKAVLR